MDDEWPGRRFVIFDRVDGLLDILKGEERRNINTPDSSGRTPVYTAVSNNSLRCLEVLLQHGADPNIDGGERTNKMTPLHQAVLEQNLEAIKLLLQYGADLNCKDETGITPVNLAEFTNNRKLLEVLRQGGGSYSKELSLGSIVSILNSPVQLCVGPFVRIQETGELCFITACHPYEYEITGVRLVLPAPEATTLKSRLCGEVVAAKREQIDAALVKIEESCIPTRMFEVTDQDLRRAGIDPSGSSPLRMGEVIDARNLTIGAGAENKIIIIGAEGRLRTGRLLLQGSFKQIPIQGVDLVNVLQIYLDSDESLTGYSGSSVFLLDNNSCLHCIGMLVGVFGSKTALAVPIQDIFEELGRIKGQTLKIATFQDSTDIRSILDPRDAYIFNQALKRGTGKDSYVRLNVIGYYAQGKTSLTRRLLHLPVEDVKSTDGIDVWKCKMKESEWESKPTENDENDCLTRIVECARSFQKKEETGQDNSRTEQTMDRSEMSEEQTETNTELKEPSTSTTATIYDRSAFRNTTAEHDIVDKDIAKETSFISGYSQRLRDQSLIPSDNYLMANIWDFGGQFIYYATHQIFHSREAIYLLVFDLTKDLNKTIIDNDFPGRQDKMKNCLKFWLNSIHAFVGPDDDEEESQQIAKMLDKTQDVVAAVEPTVILVGTHKDKFHGDINAKFNEVISLFAVSKSRNHISSRRFAVSNVDLTDEEVDKLRTAIFLLGMEQAEEKQVPMKWIPLEIALLAEKKKNILTMEEVIRLNAENDNLVEEEEMKTFLKYHHLKGSLIYFDENQLNKHVVVNPQYLVDAFRCIIRSQEFCVWNADLHPIWEYMKTTAVLERKLLDAMWSKEDGKNFSDNADLLLRYLQRHRILAELHVMDEAEDVQYQGRYMIPSLLKQCCTPKQLKQFHGKQICTRVSLGLHIKNSAILPNIFERVTAAALGKWSPIKIREQIMVFRNVGIYALDYQHAGQVACKTERGIELTVINQCGQKVESKVCDHFRRYVESVVNNEIQKLKSRRKRKNVCTYYLSCNRKEHVGTGSMEIYHLDDVREVEHVRCPDNANHSIECKIAIDEWFRRGKISESYEIPERPVTSRELSGIADCLGNNWEKLGSTLGVRQVEIDRIKMDNPGQTATCIYHMLLKWEQKELDKATLYKLIKGIEDCESLRVYMDGVKNVIDGN